MLGDLTKEKRTKVKTLITIDVHARDIVGKLITDKVENALAFAWQSQLKYRWDEELIPERESRVRQKPHSPAHTLSPRPRIAAEAPRARVGR